MNTKGSCNCGGVKFDIAAPIADVYICHCSICRKSTGSGGIAVTIVKNEDLSWVEGKDLVKKWLKPNHDWETSFCVNCGSPLPGKNDAHASYVPVSLLDSGYENLKIQAHLFVGSKAPWEKIAGNAKQHKKNLGE